MPELCSNRGSSRIILLCMDYSQTVNLYTVAKVYSLLRVEGMILKLMKYHVFSTFCLKSAYHQLELHESDKLFTASEAAGRLWECNRLPFGVTNGVPAFQSTMDSIVQGWPNEPLVAIRIFTCGCVLRHYRNSLLRFFLFSFFLQRFSPD